MKIETRWMGIGRNSGRVGLSPKEAFRSLWLWRDGDFDGGWRGVGGGWRL